MLIRSLVVTTALLSSTALGHAAEGKALLDQLVGMAAIGGTKISWASINEENSSSFVLSGVTVEKKDGNNITIDSIAVRGLNNVNGRIAYDSIAVSNMRGPTKSGGNVAIAGIASTGGDWPFDIWAGGLTPEEKRERIKFGNFSVNGIAIDDKEVKVTLDAVTMTKADIPLDFRYEPEAGKNAVGEPASPLTFDTFAVNGLNGSQAVVDFGMTSFAIKDASFPTTLNATMSDWMKIYSVFSVNGVKAAMSGTPVFAMDNFSGTITPPDAGGTASSSSQLSGLMVNLKAIPDPQAQQVINALGYEKVEGSMSGVGTYNLTTGRATADDIVLKFKDMFDLSLDYAITGYTAEVAQKIQQAQFEIAAGKPQMEAFGSILGDLGGVKLETFKMALTDHSLTGRLLDFQASQMGTTGDQLAAGAPMMIGMGMGGLQMPALTEMVTVAVGKFLKEKGTITVEATPAEPTSIVNVVMAGQADPKKIPEMINLQVSAQ